MSVCSPTEDIVFLVTWWEKNRSLISGSFPKKQFTCKHEAMRWWPRENDLTKFVLDLTQDFRRLGWSHCMEKHSHNTPFLSPLRATETEEYKTQVPKHPGDCSTVDGWRTGVQNLEHRVLLLLLYSLYSSFPCVSIWLLNEKYTIKLQRTELHC